MEFFQPEVSGIRWIENGQPVGFELQVQNLCPGTNYVDNGFTTDAGQLDSDGIFKVTAKLRQTAEDGETPDPTTITQTFDLGMINFPGGEGTFQVTTVYETASGEPPTKSGGTMTTRSGICRDMPR